MSVTPGRTKQPGEFMSGRGEIACIRCQELKRRDKLVFVNDAWLCKHCRAVLIYKLRKLEEMALLSD